MFKDIHLRVEDSKVESLVSFLKELDFVEVKKTAKKEGKVARKSKRKAPEYAYFGACPDWEMDAKDLRATGNRKKAQW